MKMQMVLCEKLHRKHPPLYCISFDATVQDAAKFMAEKNIGALLVEMPVREDGVYAGILSERDIIKCCARYSNFETLPVSEVMNKEVVAADINDNVDDVVVKMRQQHIRHITLKDNSKVVGLISIRDLMYCVDMEKEIALHHLSDMLGCTHHNINY